MYVYSPLWRWIKLRGMGCSSTPYSRNSTVFTIWEQSVKLLFTSEETRLFIILILLAQPCEKHLFLPSAVWCLTTCCLATHVAGHELCFIMLKTEKHNQNKFKIKIQKIEWKSDSCTGLQRFTSFIHSIHLSFIVIVEHIPYLVFPFSSFMYRNKDLR